jgi:hypothetical protein
MKNTFKFLLGSLSILGLLAFGILLPTRTAQADDTQPTKNPWKQTMEPLRQTAQALPTQNTADLTNLLNREKLTLSNQAVRLDLAGQVASVTQSYIDEQKALGKDTSAMETALATFKQAITSAQSYHDQAASLLANPAGFDSNGQVTDAKTARQTLHSAGQALRQAHTTLTTASLNLRVVVKEFRTANKGK